MPRTIRFHLDENCDPRIAAALRLHGVDVTTAADAGLLQASDDTHLDYASTQDRVIVTHDMDFLRVIAAGRSSPGIVFIPAQSRSIGQIVRSILLVWEVYEPEDMQNRVEYF